MRGVAAVFFFSCIFAPFLSFCFNLSFLQMPSNSQAEICRHIGAIKEKYRHSRESGNHFTLRQGRLICAASPRGNSDSRFRGNDRVLFIGGNGVFLFSRRRLACELPDIYNSERGEESLIPPSLPPAVRGGVAAVDCRQHRAL
jgi:hypothetical protein